TCRPPGSRETFAAHAGPACGRSARRARLGDERRIGRGIERERTAGLGAFTRWYRPAAAPDRPGRQGVRPAVPGARPYPARRHPAGIGGKSRRRAGAAAIVKRRGTGGTSGPAPGEDERAPPVTTARHTGRWGGITTGRSARAVRTRPRPRPWRCAGSSGRARPRRRPPRGTGRAPPRGRRPTAPPRARRPRRAVGPA